MALFSLLKNGLGQAVNFSVSQVPGSCIMVQSYSPGSHCQQDQMGLISSNPEIQMVDSLYETTGNRECSEVRCWKPPTAHRYSPPSAYNKGIARKRVSLALIQQACWAKSRTAIQLLHDFLCLIHPLLKYSLNAKSWCYTDCSKGRSPLINDMGIITFSAADGAERPYCIRQFFHLFILVMNRIHRNMCLAFTESNRH